MNLNVKSINQNSNISMKIYLKKSYKKIEEHFWYHLLLLVFFFLSRLLPVNICEIFIVLSHSISLTLS